MVKIEWMDGGMLFELNKKYDDFGEQAVKEDKDLIKYLYLNYIKLGSTFITTNNYAFKPDRKSVV